MAHHAPDCGADARKRLFAPLTRCPTWISPILHDGPVIDFTRDDYREIPPAFIADAAMKRGR